MDKTQAIALGAAWGRVELHRGKCTRTVGPRGGITIKREVWRTNGKCKTWKMRPDHFELPIKYGFNGPYDYITPFNAAEFHLAADCECAS